MATTRLAAGGEAVEGTAAVLFVVLLAALAAAYGRGVYELWNRRGGRVVVSRLRVLAFGAGVVTLVAAQSPPVHAMASNGS